MLIINSLNELHQIEGETGIALGTFDGIHLGHQLIISNLVDVCRERGLKSVLYTFSNHPRELTDSANKSTRILTKADKIAVIENLGVDYLVLVEFDDNHRSIEAKRFIKDILLGQLKARLIAVGYNYRFGKGAEGDVVLLQKYDEFEVVITEPIYHKGELVSSSLIRSLLNNGFLENANELIGRPYMLKGVVAPGKKLGRSLGFPTANLKITDDMTVLKPGVYITRTHLDGQTWRSVTNVGFNPTFNQINFNVETYLLDYHTEGDLYDCYLEVEFLKRLRDEMRFEGLDALIARINEDVAIANKFFDALTTCDHHSDQTKHVVHSISEQ